MKIELSWIKESRTYLGLTQVQTASRSNVSLPMLQLIEAGKTNPSIDTLQKLARALGYIISFQIESPNLDYFSFLGAPINALSKSPDFFLNKTSLLKQLQLVCAELQSKPEPRIQEATQSLLLAIHDHFPTFYKQYIGPSPLISSFLPQKKYTTGRHIKLKRIALARISEYL